MKVVLFNIGWLNFKQAAIGIFTWSKVCHCGLLFNSDSLPILYDASESRGNVDYNRHINAFGNQKITVYDIPDSEVNAKKYALSKRYEKYDWKGIMGWFPFLASNDPKTVYCFELVLQTLLSMESINGQLTKEIAGDLRQKLFIKPIDSDDIVTLMERLQLSHSYQGKAKDYK